MKILFIFFIFTTYLFSSEVVYRPLEAMPYNEKLANIGKKFYFDINLSPKKISCNTCHNLNLTGSGTNYSGIITDNEMNPPTILNIAYSNLFFKDADVTNMKEQVIRSLKNTMEVTEASFNEAVKNNVKYKRRFEKIGLKPSFDSLVDSLVEFEKSLITIDSPFDMYLKGNEKAISENAKKGFELFKHYGCTSCHIGDNFGGNIIASVDNYFSSACNLNNDRVKVPPLRNIEVTAPYGYIGAFENLEDIVMIMIACQLGINAPYEDIQNITEFLKTLTGKRPKIMEK